MRTLVGMTKPQDGDEESHDGDHGPDYRAENYADHRSRDELYDEAFDASAELMRRVR